jgi:hypothetical protein
MDLPITITIDQAGSGRLRARLNNEEPYEAECLDDLMTHLGELLCEIRNDLEDAWDRETTREATEELRRGGGIPLEQIRAELGL